MVLAIEGDAVLRPRDDPDIVDRTGNDAAGDDDASRRAGDRRCS